MCIIVTINYACTTLSQGVGSLIEVKIADFGLSALVRIGEDGYDVEESSKRKKYKGLTEMWGTKEYFAPELIDQAYGPQADLWALGCILFEMLCGHQGQQCICHITIPRSSHPSRSFSSYSFPFPETAHLISSIIQSYNLSLMILSPNFVSQLFQSARGTMKIPFTAGSRRANTISPGEWNVVNEFMHIVAQTLLHFVLPCHILSATSSPFCPAMPCPAMPCPALPCAHTIHAHPYLS